MTTAESNFELAAKYIKGDGVQKDAEKAFALLLDAANAGHIKAQYNLGVMYLNGVGKEKNVEQASHFFNLAANQGYEHARQALEKINPPILNTEHEELTAVVPHTKIRGGKNQSFICQSCMVSNESSAIFCFKCGAKLSHNPETIQINSTNNTTNGKSLNLTNSVTSTNPKDATSTNNAQATGANKVRSYVLFLTLFAIAMWLNFYVFSMARWNLSGEWNCQQNNGIMTTDKYGFFGSFLQTNVNGSEARLQLAGRYSLSKKSYDIVLDSAIKDGRTVNFDENNRMKFNVKIIKITSETLSYVMSTTSSEKTAQITCTRI